jgi:hypothetical protein
LPYDARTLNAFSRGKPCGVWFLAQPVDGTYRLNDYGKQSRRRHQNVTAWRYLLIESDRHDIAPAEWLAALALLPLPIVSICETGGRLAHALIRVDAPSKEAWDHAKDALVPALTMIGADIHILSAVRLTRLPCCQRLGTDPSSRRTGKAGAATTTGFDRGSFGRNSKVLFSWVRAQINVAPYDENDNGYAHYCFR